MTSLTGAWFLDIDNTFLNATREEALAALWSDEVQRIEFCHRASVDVNQTRVYFQTRRGQRYRVTPNGAEGEPLLHVTFDADEQLEARNKTDAKLWGLLDARFEAPEILDCTLIFQRKALCAVEIFLPNNPPVASEKDLKPAIDTATISSLSDTWFRNRGTLTFRCANKNDVWRALQEDRIERIEFVQDCNMGGSYIRCFYELRALTGVAPANRFFQHTTCQLLSMRFLKERLMSKRMEQDNAVWELLDSRFSSTLDDYMITMRRRVNGHVGPRFCEGMNRWGHSHSDRVSMLSTVHSHFADKHAREKVAKKQQRQQQKEEAEEEEL